MSLETFEAAVIQVQLTLADRLSPALREASFQVGRFGLALYLSLPWYRRLWVDLRSGRAWRNVATALRSLL